MRIREIVVAAMLLAGLAGAPAQAVVIDFEALEHGGTGQLALSGTGKFYSENGFDFNSSSTTNNFAVWGTASANYLGSTALWNGDGTGVTGITTLTRTGGGSFDLNSIDVGELFVTGSGIATVEFVGTFFGGGTISQSFTTDGVRATGSGFETVDFTGFTDLVSVSWLQVTPFIQFDNVTLDEAPVSAAEPAALAILGLGFAALGLYGRRRRT